MTMSAGRRLAAITIAVALVAAPGVLARRNAMCTPAKAAAPAAAHQLGEDEALRQDPAKIVKGEAEWKKLLTPGQFNVLRRAGTEVAVTGALWNEHRRGVYRCAACGYDLFSSDTKFESGTGWPSFWAPIVASHVEDTKDSAFGMVREEVRCARCGSHLGHVFDDGPRPTGLRYCMNSAALTFAEVKK